MVGPAQMRGSGEEGEDFEGEGEARSPSTGHDGAESRGKPEAHHSGFEWRSFDVVYM